MSTQWINSIVPVIADALSRVCPLQSSDSMIKESNIDVIPVHHITQIAPVSQTRLQELRLATWSDPTLKSLSKIIHEDWQQSKKDCPEQPLEFWNFRQEISEENGILYKNHKYTLAEFRDFMKDWQNEYKVSSPRNPQSNGMAERCVQTTKVSLLKTIEEGKDVNLALLTYKTMPLNHSLPSPAELLNSRKYKTLLPTRILPTRLQESYRQIMDKGKQMQAQLYDKNTRVLPRLEQSQKVVVQLDPNKNIWTPAEIIQCPTPDGRSYSLRTTYSRIYTRNRRFIKLDLTATETPIPRWSTDPVPTRPTRTTKKPDRLIESK